MKEQFMPENYQDLLDEITQGIEIEYAILEEQESLIPELIAEDGPIEPWDYDLSASPGDCLLCPYCRCSMMNSQRNQQNFLLYECPNCTNHLLIENSGNTWNIHQFCDQLAQIFQRFTLCYFSSLSLIRPYLFLELDGRHQQSCCHSNAEIPNSVDMFLTFQQVNDVFMAYCDQCGYLEEIRLSR